MAAKRINDKVEVHDPVADQSAREKAELSEVAGERRKAALGALCTELAYLERQPVPNERRIGEVKAEIARASRSGGRSAARETAIQD